MGRYKESRHPNNEHDNTASGRFKMLPIAISRHSFWNFPRQDDQHDVLEGKEKGAIVILIALQGVADCRGGAVDFHSATALYLF